MHGSSTATLPSFARYILKRVPFKGKSTNENLEKACGGGGGAAAVEDEDAAEELEEVKEGKVPMRSLPLFMQAACEQRRASRPNHTLF